MNEETVQKFASEHGLDVRPIQPYHYRLMSEYELPVFDIFFKRNKAGKIIKNSVFDFQKRKWKVAYSTKDLLELIGKK